MPRDLWWEEASSGDAPANAIICGHTESGEKLYVGRGYVDGDLIPGEVHPSEHCCYVSNDGVEHALKDYEVLIGRDTDKFEWVTSTDGTVPTGAIVGGKVASSGEELFVARGAPREEPGWVHGGKLHPSKGYFYFAQGGKEYSMQEYEVLCEKSSSCTLL